MKPWEVHPEPLNRFWYWISQSVILVESNFDVKLVAYFWLRIWKCIIVQFWWLLKVGNFVVDVVVWFPSMKLALWEFVKKFNTRKKRMNVLFSLFFIVFKQIVLLCSIKKGSTIASWVNSEDLLNDFWVMFKTSSQSKASYLLMYVLS